MTTTSMPAQLCMKRSALDAAPPQPEATTTAKGNHTSFVACEPHLCLALRPTEATCSACSIRWSNSAYVGVIPGLYRVYMKVSRDNAKENGSYYLGFGVHFLETRGNSMQRLIGITQIPQRKPACRDSKKVLKIMDAFSGETLVRSLAANYRSGSTQRLDSLEKHALSLYGRSKDA